MKVIGMADDRIQANSEFANQAASNSANHNKESAASVNRENIARDSKLEPSGDSANRTSGSSAGPRSADGLSRLKRYSSQNRQNTAIGGYAVSSSRSTGSRPNQRLGDNRSEAPNKTLAGDKAADSRGKSDADRESKASQQQQQSAASGKKTQQAAGEKRELAEDEYYAKPLGARILFWILRKSLVPIIMIVMLFAGLYIGYTVLGHQPKDEVFEWPTWRHLYDLIFEGM